MTLAELRNLWYQRDYRYTLRRYDLPPECIEPVRRWRQTEADTLAPPVRGAAYREASMWTAPERIKRMVP